MIEEKIKLPDSSQHNLAQLDSPLSENLSMQEYTAQYIPPYNASFYSVYHNNYIFIYMSIAYENISSFQAQLFTARLCGDWCMWPMPHMATTWLHY